jgi:tetratricopeptide (TPR) repeat protein
MMVHNKRLRRLAVVAFMVAAALTVGFGPGDDAETLVFEDNRPLTLTWDQAKDGVDVKVCNVGDTRLQSLRAVLTGFNFQVNENLVPDEAVLKQPPTTTSWDTEKCTSVTIQTIKRPVPPAPGTYTGLVVISSPGAGMIRREVIIQVESDTPEPTPVEGAAGKLAFEDKSDLTLTWEQAKTKVNVNVCNDGNAQLQSLQAVLTGFNFLENKILVADEEVLKAPAITSTLDAEKCTSVTIQASGESIPDPGKYEGVLVVSAVKGDGTTERISLKVTVELAPVESAFEKIILTATRYGPLSRAVRLDNHYLPLQPTGNGETPTPASKDTLIGIINNEGRLGRVCVDGPVKTEEGVNLLPVRIDGLEDVGTYSGKLDVAGTSDAKQAIPIEVKVTDHIGWAIGAIILGLVLALVSMFYMQRWRHLYELNRRRDLLVENYRDAKAAFDDSVAGNPSFKGYEPDYDVIRQYRDGFDEALKAYTSSYRLLFDTSSEEFKKLIKTLETAEDDAKVFGEPENCRSLFGQALQKLQESLESFRQFVNDQFPSPRKPAFVKYAAYLLEGRKLKVGEAQKIKNKADEYVELVKQWKDMAANIQRYRLWGEKLLEKESEISGTVEPMPNWDSEMLRRALARVEEASNELLDATDATTLAGLGAAEDLKRAYGHLAYLGGRYKVWVQPDEEERLLDALMAARGWGGFKTGTWFLSECLVITPEEAAVILQAARWVGDAFVLTLGVALALYTGLTTLYFDKTFGTVANYLSAIALALATPTVLKFLTDAIKQFGTPLKS